jgi:HAD superfamily hydrolase (TIGR01509 family)
MVCGEDCRTSLPTEIGGAAGIPTSAARVAFDAEQLRPPECVRALLFDWDGTLANTTYANYLALRHALSTQNLTLDLTWFEAHAGLSTRDVIDAAAAAQSVTTVDATELQQLRDAHYLRHLNLVTPVHPVLQMAEHQHGRCRLAVVSGGSRRSVTATIGHLGVGHLFDVVVTREDAAHGKPWPDLYLTALDRLAVAANDAMAYEDSDEGLLAARSAGLAAVDVRPLRRTEPEPPRQLRARRVRSEKP